MNKNAGETEVLHLAQHVQNFIPTTTESGHQGAHLKSHYSEREAEKNQNVKIIQTQNTLFKNKCTPYNLTNQKNEIKSSGAF